MSDPISQPEASPSPVAPVLVASSPDERRDLANTSSRFHATVMGDEDWDPNLHQVLKAVIIARTPLSAQSISDLTGMETERVARAVSTLHDFLDVDEAGFIHTTNPSLRDYLTNLACCGSGSPWFIDVEGAECELAQQCLSLLSRRLKYNAMDLDTTVDFQRTQVRRDSTWTTPQYKGPASTQYACMVWIEHVCCVQRVDLLPELYSHITQFFSAHFLPWLEVLSVLKHSRDAIHLLGQLHSWCLSHKATSLYNTRLCELIYDSWRFVNTFAQTIEAYPLLIYDTALPFLPRHTAIGKVLTSQPARVPEVLVGGLSGWDSCLYSMTRHRAPVQGLALCPQTKTVISAGWDISLRMWNYETGVETQPRLNCAAVIAHRMSIASVQFSPDHSVVFTGSMDGTICCWDAKTNQLKTRLVDPATPRVIPVFAMPGTRIYSMAVLLDGNLIATGRQDGKVALWNLDDSNRADVDLVGHTDAVYCIHTNADKDFLVSGSADTTVRLWDVRARTSTKIYRGHTGAIRAVALSPDMSCIVSGSADNTVRLWATDDSAECAVLQGHTDEILAVAFSLDGRYIASGGRDHKICLWTVAGHRLFQQSTSHAGPIYSLLFCDPTRLISGTERGEVHAWRVSETQGVDNEVQWLHPGCVYAVAVSNGGSLFASGCGSSTVILWNAQTGQPVFPSLTNHAARITCLAFSPDDSTLASGSRDGTLRLLDTTTGKALEPILTFSSDVYFLAFSRHGSYLAIGLEDGTVVLWDIITHKRTLELSTTPHGSLRALGLSNRPGKVAAMYCEPNGAPGIVVWNDTTGDILLHKAFTVGRGDLESELFLEGTYIEFSGDDLHVLVRYHYARDGLIEAHAFELSTGVEAPQIANSTRRLYAQNAEIYHGDAIIMPLPRDFKTTDIVRTWAVSGDVIMMGMDSGRVYAVDFGPRLQELEV